MTREGREETRRFGRSDEGKTGDATTHHEGYEPGQEPPAEQPQLQHSANRKDTTALWKGWSRAVEAWTRRVVDEEVVLFACVRMLAIISFVFRISIVQFVFILAPS